MNLWIRFEDRYGIADIACKCWGIEYLDDVNAILEVKRGTYVSHGLSSSGCLQISKDDIDRIKTNGITDIVTVIDLDNEDGKKDKIISEKYLRDAYNSMKTDLKTGGVGDVNVKFMPVAYAAETLELYQFISSNEWSTVPEEVVHNRNTNEFHLILIALLTNITNIKRAKQTRKFLDLGLLKYKFKKNAKYRNTNVNSRIIEWVLTDCSNNFEFMSIEELLDFRTEAEKIFNKYITIEQSLVINGRKLSTFEKISKLNKELDALDKVKNQSLGFR
jgi:hypothetical protein